MVLYLKHNKTRVMTSWVGEEYWGEGGGGLPCLRTPSSSSRAANEVLCLWNLFPGAYFVRLATRPPSSNTFSRNRGSWIGAAILLDQVILTNIRLPLSFCRIFVYQSFRL